MQHMYIYYTENPVRLYACDCIMLYIAAFKLYVLRFCMKHAELHM